MRFTNEDLAKLLGLKIGDRIKTSKGYIADITEDYKLDYHPGKSGLPFLVDEEFEILPPKKKTGDLICKDVDCDTCPLRALHCDAAYSDTLYKILERHFTEMGIKDKEIYNILKARLDKEMKE